MDKNKYIDDLREIKDIMARTTQIISLSGLSGISTGIIALIGVYAAQNLVFERGEYFKYTPVIFHSNEATRLVSISALTLVLSIGFALYFTNKKSKSMHQKIFDFQSKRLLLNLFIPLTTGGILCLQLLSKGMIGILPSITLIFYGLALINASKFTMTEIRNLGIIQIILGLLAFEFINYSLIFWCLGFGFFQIAYGLIIQKRY